MTYRRPTEQQVLKRILFATAKYNLRRSKMGLPTPDPEDEVASLNFRKANKIIQDSAIAAYDKPKYSDRELTIMERAYIDEAIHLVNKEAAKHGQHLGDGSAKELIAAISDYVEVE